MRHLLGCRIAATRWIVGSFVLLAILTSARAHGADDFRIVAEFTNAYIEANSCEPDLADESRIVQFTRRAAKGRSVPVPGKFAVLWHGDEGCAGGSGTNRPHISVVLLSSSGKPQFLPGEKSTIVEFQVIDKLLSASEEDGVVVTGSTWQPGDADCCATKHVRATLRRGRHGYFETERGLQRRHRIGSPA
jgi:hypothetical protein